MPREAYYGPAKHPPDGIFVQTISPISSKRFTQLLHLLFLTLANIVTATSSAVAQPELGRIAVEYVGSSDFVAPPIGAEEVDIATLSLRASALVPLPLGEEGTIVLVGAHYGLLAPQVDGGAGDTAEAHEIGISGGILVPLNEQWRLMGIVAPSIASDFRELSGDAINVRGSLSATVDLNEALRFGFGLLLSYEFGRLLPLPLLSMRWQPNPETTLAIEVPRGIQFSYFPWERIELGASLRLQGGRYEVSPNDPLSPANNLRVTTLDIGPRAAVRLAGPIWLELYGGVTLFRNFELFESSGDSLFDSQLRNSFVLQASVMVRPPRPRPSIAALW